MRQRTSRHLPFFLIWCHGSAVVPSCAHASCESMSPILSVSRVSRQSVCHLLPLFGKPGYNPGAPLVREVGIGPLQQDGELVAEADKENQVDE